MGASKVRVLETREGSALDRTGAASVSPHGPVVAAEGVGLGIPLLGFTACLSLCPWGSDQT